MHLSPKRIIYIKDREESNVNRGVLQYAPTEYLNICNKYVLE